MNRLIMNLCMNNDCKYMMKYDVQEIHIMAEKMVNLIIETICLISLFTSSSIPNAFKADLPLGQVDGQVDGLALNIFHLMSDRISNRSTLNPFSAKKQVIIDPTCDPLSSQY